MNIIIFKWIYLFYILFIYISHIRGDIILRETLVDSIYIKFFLVKFWIFIKIIFLEKNFVKNWPKKFQIFNVLGPPKKVGFEPKKLS